MSLLIVIGCVLGRFMMLLRCTFGEYQCICACAPTNKNLNRCLVHIINLATQALISTRSKSKYFSPHDERDDDSSTPVSDRLDRDEVGLIWAICVKVGLFSTHLF